MRIEIETLIQWLRANKLSLNVKKTKYMIIGNKNKLNGIQDVNINVNNEPIERVNKFKYLGLIIDQHLTWDSHIDYTYMIKQVKN